MGELLLVETGCATEHILADLGAVAVVVQTLAAGLDILAKQEFSVVIVGKVNLGAVEALRDAAPAADVVVVGRMATAVAARVVNAGATAVVAPIEARRVITFLWKTRLH